jgi:hypothetical protein
MKTRLNILENTIKELSQSHLELIKVRQKEQAVLARIFILLAALVGLVSLASL